MASFIGWFLVEEGSIFVFPCSLFWLDAPCRKKLKFGLKLKSPLFDGCKQLIAKEKLVTSEVCF